MTQDEWQEYDDWRQLTLPLPPSDPIPPDSTNKWDATTTLSCCAHVIQETSQWT